MRRGKIGSPWPAVMVLGLGVMLAMWLYPLAYLDIARTGQGLLCNDLYGQPQVFLAQGVQPEQVVSTERWTAFPPGWICEFRAYQSDLLVIREPANWRAWTAVVAVFLLAVGVAWLLLRAWRVRRTTQRAGPCSEAASTSRWNTT